jgi:hypothetical protein
MVVRQRAGRPGDMRDTMIAGIFADLSVPVVNPWQA